MINKFTLKLNDPNKEQIYRQQASHHLSVLTKLKTLRVSIFAFFVLVAEQIYKIVVIKRGQPARIEKISLAIFLVIAVQGMLVYYVVQKVKWSYSEALLKLQTVIAVVLMTVQQVLFKEKENEDCEDCFLQLYLAIILLVSFRFTHVYVIFLLNMALYGFYVHQVAKS